MSNSPDLEFARACTDAGFIDADKANRAFKIQLILAGIGIRRTVADILVETDWIRFDQAGKAFQSLKISGVAHPDLGIRPPVKDSAAWDRMSPDAKKHLETVCASLITLGLKVGPATLAGQGGVPPPKVHVPSSDPVPRITSRRAPPKVNRVKQGLQVAGSLALALGLPLTMYLIYQAKFAKPPLPDTHESRVPPPPPPAPSPTPTMSPTPTPTEEPEPTATSAPDPGMSPEAIEEQKKLFRAKQEESAAKVFAEALKLIDNSEWWGARKKLLLLRDSYGWTQFVEKKRDEIGAKIRQMDKHFGQPGGDEPEVPDAPPGVDLEAKKNERLAKANKNVQKASTALEMEASAFIKRVKAARLRIKGEKVNVMLRNGQELKGATILDFTPDDIKLQGPVDGAPADVLVAWDALDNASFLAVHRLINKGMGAEGHFEVGRQAASRQLWKDAQAAFAEAAKDKNYASKVPDLGGASLFRGVAQRIGRDMLQVRYDDPETAKELKEIIFDRNLSIDLVGGGAVTVGLFTDAAGKGWPVAFTVDGPAHISVQAGLYRVTAAGKEIAAGFVDGKLQGRLTFEGIKNVSVMGRVLPTEIVRRFGPSDFLVRNAVQNDFMRKQPLGTDAAPLTAEDDVFASKLPEPLKGDYKKAREMAVESMRRGVIDPGAAALLDKVVQGAADYAPAHYWRGVFRWMTGRRDEAQRDFTAALAKNIDFPEAHAALAECYLDDGDMDKAGTHAGEAVKRQPDLAMALALQGQVRFLQGDARMALIDLEIAARVATAEESPAWWMARQISAAIRGPVQLRCRQVKEFGHFALFTDGATEKAVPYGEKLEAAFKYHAETFKDLYKEEMLASKLRAIVFGNRESFVAYLHALGNGGGDPVHYDSVTREIVILDVPGSEVALNESAARQFLAVIAPKLAAWAREGLTATLATRGAISAGILAPMKAAVRAAGPIDAIMARPAADFGGADTARSLALAHFLLKGPDRPSFDSYLKSVSDGREASAAFDATFGRKDVKKLEADWKASVEKLEATP